MDKELIIIASYCNTKEKKEILLSFLQSLQPFRDDYSVLLSSHIPIDYIFYDYIDHFYYNNDNTILKTPTYNYNSWFGPKDNYIIWSTYVEFGNTHAAIWSMLIPSIKIGNIFGYKKIHCFEYDSVVHRIDELKDNSKLLDNYDYILYRGNGGHLLVGGFYSFKTEKIIDELKKYDVEKIKSLYVDDNYKIPENIFFKLIETQRKFLIKKHEDLITNGIETSKVRGHKYYWDVPFYDVETGQLLFISYNNNGEDYEIKIIVNDNLIYNIKGLIPEEWKIIKLLDNFYDVHSLLVLRNNEKIIDLSFDDNSRSEFIKYNRSTNKL